MTPALAVLLAAALGLVGVSSARSAEFQLWHGLNGPARQALEDECAGFNRSQAQDHITCIGLGSYEVALQRAAAAFRAGRQPAILHVFDVATQEMIYSGATRPLAIGVRDELPPVRSLYAADPSTVYALPWNASTLLLYANHDLLARAGAAAPPETWEDFEATALKLKQAGVTCPFAFRLDPWWWLEQANAVAGAPVATQADGRAGLKARFVFAASIHRRMMQNLLRWRRQGLAVLFDDSALGSAQRAFVRGQCAMVLDTSGAAGGFASLTSGAFKVDIGLTPRFSDTPRRSTLAGGGAFWVLKGATLTIDAAVNRFLSFVQDPEQQARLAQSTGYLPLSQSGRRLFAAKPGVAHLQRQAVALAILSLNQGAPAQGARLGAYVRFRAIWLEEMQRAFSGAETLDEALDRSQTRGNALLRRFEATYQDPSLAIRR